MMYILTLPSSTVESCIFNTVMQGFADSYAGFAANLIPFYCFVAFSILITRCKSSKAAWAAVISVFMLLLQPVMKQVYAGPAFLSVLLAWEMLDIGFIKPLESVPNSVLDLYLVAFAHSVHGMLTVKQKRTGSSCTGSRSESNCAAAAGAAHAEVDLSSRASATACSLSRQQPLKPLEATTRDGMLTHAAPIPAETASKTTAVAPMTDSPSSASIADTVNSVSSKGTVCQPVVGLTPVPRALFTFTSKHLFTAAHVIAFIKASVVVVKRLLVFNLGFAFVMACSSCRTRHSAGLQQTPHNHHVAFPGNGTLTQLASLQPLSVGFNPVLYALQQVKYLLQASTAVQAMSAAALEFPSSASSILQHAYTSMAAATGLQPVLQYAELCAYSTAAGVVLTTQAALFWSSVKWMVVVAGQLQLAAALPDDAFGGLLMATSIGDLWGKRWHQFYRYYFTSVGGKLAALITRPFSHCLTVNYRKQVMSAARVLAAFFLSGFLHEYVLYAAYGTLSGSNMAFFMVHGIAVVLEQLVQKLVPGVVRGLPAWVGRAWAVGFAVASAPLMVRPFIENGYFCAPVQPGLWGDMGVGTVGVLILQVIYSAVKTGLSMGHLLPA